MSNEHAERKVSKRQIADAVALYDQEGGLANDTRARWRAITFLGHRGFTVDAAARALAEALARRAANKQIGSE